MHHLFLDCHQGIDWYPSVTENCKLLQPITHQNTTIFDINKHDLSQFMVLVAPSQQRSTKIALIFRYFYQHVFSNKYLLDLKRIPIVAGIRKDCSSWQLVIANNICNPLCLCMISYSQRSSHLLPKILYLQWFQSRFYKFQDIR